MPPNAGDSILGRLKVGPKVALIPLFFILDIAVIIAYTITTIQDQRSDADLIRFATRQRDLNQRHTKEVLLVSQGLAPEGKIDVALLEHISPIEWDNVILYGQYVLDRAQVR